MDKRSQNGTRKVGRSKVELLVWTSSAVALATSLFLMLDPVFVLRLIKIETSHLHRVGTMQEIRNDIRRKVVDELLWLPAENEAAVFMGDTVFSGAGSAVKIDFDGDGSIVLKENSLVQISSKDGKAQIDLLNGDVDANIKDPGRLTIKRGHANDDGGADNKGNVVIAAEQANSQQDQIPDDLPPSEKKEPVEPNKSAVSSPTPTPPPSMDQTGPENAGNETTKVKSKGEKAKVDPAVDADLEKAASKMDLKGNRRDDPRPSTLPYPPDKLTFAHFGVGKVRIIPAIRCVQACRITVKGAHLKKEQTFATGEQPLVFIPVTADLSDDVQWTYTDGPQKLTGTFSVRPFKDVKVGTSVDQKIQTNTHIEVLGQ
jgi:hypothetical protein